ncbi:MAG TPA: fused MFS/spermidine synthase, partial [Gemmatales bacterium]|nr:fused MFS/spermidine synthase [Gemmatales bacterium]
HSDLKDPSYLSYEYLRIYDELVGWKLNRKKSTRHRELFVGGGGYTLQRYFHQLYPDCQIDVVEIDPYVTEVAYSHMGAPRNDPRLFTKNEDGRLFVKDRQNTNDRYEFIFGDAFNDLSVPFHLTTLEFDQQMKNLLTEDGLVMSLVIDDVARGLFLPSFLATMQAAFGEENVVLILVGGLGGKERVLNYLKKHELEKYIPDLCALTLEDAVASWDQEKYSEQIAYLHELKMDDHAPFIKPTTLDYVRRQDTVIVVGSNQKQDWDDFEKYLEELSRKYDEENIDKSVTSRVVRADVISKYLKTRTRQPSWWETYKNKSDRRVAWQPIILTDDHAPVDNLLAPLFEQRFGYRKPVKPEVTDEDLLIEEMLKLMQ